MTIPAQATYTARLTVRECLAANDLSAYRVAQEGRGFIARNTVYALARNRMERLDLTSLARLAQVLERLTGQATHLSDLMTLERAD